MPEGSETKGVVPFASAPVVEGDWDGSGARKRLQAWATADGEIDFGKYEKGFAWFDSDNADTLGAYKLPHHDIRDGEFVTHQRGTQAAMGALLGARGGTDLPDAQKRGVYNHLKKHYEQWDGEVPEYRDFDTDESKRVLTFDTEIIKGRRGTSYGPLGPRTVRAKISTTSIDREGDVLLPSGLDLQDYKKNPVVLLNHNDRGLPVGRAVKVKRESDGVVAEVEFAERPEGHPDAVEWIPDTVFSLFQQDILRAFSVGFIPKDMRDPTDKDFRKFGDGVKNVITDWSLLEFSVVNVPANQDALVMDVAKSHKWLADAWGITSGQLEYSSEKKRWQHDGDLPRLRLEMSPRQ